VSVRYWLLAVLLAPCAAAAADLEPMSPDRASITSNTTVVPRGWVQVEVGAELQRRRVAGEPSNDRIGVEAMVRAGVADRWELRVNVEPLVRLSGASEDSGFGDVIFSVKGRLLDQSQDAWWPSIGVQPFLKVPTASAPRGSERPDFGGLLIASRDLFWDFSVDVDVGLAGIGQEGSRSYLLQGGASGVLNVPVIPPTLSGFLELAFASAEERGGRGALLFNTGLVYLATSWLALDVSVSTTVSGSGPNLAVRGGLSARFGR
jgi:hypothetical protein